MQVKATSIQNLTDARYFASHSVEWMGFCFDPASKSFVSPREAQQIMAWVEGPRMMGEFGAQSPKEIQETAMILGLKGIQVDVGHLNDDLYELKIPLSVRIPLRKNEDIDDIADYYLKDYFPLEFLLLDLSTNFDSWDAFLSESDLGLIGLQQLATEYPLILATHFNKNNISSIIDVINPAAIQLSGSIEQKTGEKLFDELEEVFAALEIGD